MSHTKCLSFSPLSLILFKISKCIVFLWTHREQLHLHLLNLIKYLAMLKLTQLLRKFIWRHLWVSVANTVSLKGIEQLVFKQWPFEVCQVFLIYTTLPRYQKHFMVNVQCKNCHMVIGQCKMKLCLQGGVNMQDVTM